jgi:hypothetical protein
MEVTARHPGTFGDLGQPCLLNLSSSQQRRKKEKEKQLSQERSHTDS